MIESLAEHGVDPADLVPALMTTHTVKNPEFDPEAKRKADLAAVAEAEAEAEAKAEAEVEAEAEEKGREAREAEILRLETESILDPAPPYEEAVETDLAARRMPSLDDEEGDIGQEPVKEVKQPRRLPSFDDEDGDIGAALGSPEEGDIGATIKPEEGDIGAAMEVPEEGDIGSAMSPTPTKQAELPIPKPEQEDDGDIAAVQVEEKADEKETETGKVEEDKSEHPAAEEDKTPRLPEVEDFQAMPHLPGVSTTITSADEDVTLDIRWTVVSILVVLLVLTQALRSLPGSSCGFYLRRSVTSLP